jgi:hypothetical protein
LQFSHRGYTDGVGWIMASRIDWVSLQIVCAAIHSRGRS